MEIKAEPKEPWLQRWVTGQTGWDQGQEHPELMRLLAHARLEGALVAGANIFSAGCGRAHNEAFLARQGYRVHSVDFVAEAIAAAQVLYAGIPGLSFAVQDALAEHSDDRLYDAVFDRAMLCAIQPSLRPVYIQRLVQRLKAGGLLFAILFREVRGPKGPPFACDELNAFELLQADFELCHASSCMAMPQPHAVLDEWLCVWRKKASSDERIIV